MIWRIPYTKNLKLTSWLGRLYLRGIDRNPHLKNPQNLRNRKKNKLILEDE